MKSATGYTMIEMLSVISIMTIMTTLGVPSFRYVTNSNRVSAEINQLYSDMESARSAALREGLPVTLCPSTDKQTCSEQSQSWQSGWIMFLDFNGNGAVDPGDTIMHVSGAFASTTDTLAAGQNAAALTFNREGFASNLPNTAAGFITFTLHTVPLSSNWTRCVQVTLVGMITTEHALQGACT
jgi:type IV fimbrial biogenesis protein FimT